MQSKLKFALIVLVILIGGVLITKRSAREANPPPQEDTTAVPMPSASAPETALTLKSTPPLAPVAPSKIADTSLNSKPPQTKAVPTSEKTKITVKGPSLQQIGDFFSTQRSEDEVMKFLEDQRIAAFGAVLENSKPILIPDSNINGCFKGEARLANGIQWQVSARHFLSEPGKSNAGTYTISVQGPGKSSIAREQSSTQDLKSNSDLPGQIILETSPTEAIQLFYVPLNDEYVGNFYQKLTALDYKFIGAVWLYRSEGCQ